MLKLVDFSNVIGNNCKFVIRLRIPIDNLFLTSGKIDFAHCTALRKLITIERNLIGQFSRI